MVDARPSPRQQTRSCDAILDAVEVGLAEARIVSPQQLSWGIEVYLSTEYRVPSTERS
jgi:hypothetical protein